MAIHHYLNGCIRSRKIKPDIVSEASVSTGAVYHYFAGKEELAKAIHDHAVQEFLRRFDRQVRSKQNTRERIHAFVELMFTWTEEEPEMVDYLLYARPKEVLNKPMSICAEEGLEAVKEIIRSGIATKTIKAMDVFAAAAPLSGTVARFIELRLDGLVCYPLTEVIDETAENIWLGLKN